jgi:two-component system, response regulator FlrC
MRLLIVGSLNGYVSAAAKIAINHGAKVSHVPEIEAGLESLRSGKGADLVMVDLKLDIVKFIAALKSERIAVPVVACGVNPDPDRAAEAIRAGANEYITLPPDPELIAAVLKSVAKDDLHFIHSDAKTKQILTFAARIAPSEANILITGESGTGKEVMANFIHQNSKRKERPFISLNCAAIPENLLESELFGHEKGSFTGAIARRIGKFEEANGGTLLLDEVTEMHPRLQAKLLRAIQERVIDRVGGTHPIKVDIRIIATSNRNMLEAVKAQEFREDLYFRLNVVNINMPSLNQRMGDVEPLANYFIQKYCELNHTEKKILSSEALNALLTHQWTGNVRELENSIHRAVLMAQNEVIMPDDIFGQNGVQSGEINIDSAGSGPILVGRRVAEVERELILHTVDHCLGNRTHAANILGISIRTLRNKLKEYSDTGYISENQA